MRRTGDEEGTPGNEERQFSFFSSPFQSKEKNIRKKQIKINNLLIAAPVKCWI